MPVEVEAAPRLLGLEAIANRLSIGRSGVYKLLGSGQLKSVKVGRRRLVTERALREYIANLEAQTAAVH